ncbi:general APC amino acid permease, partial [Scleroderma citrinum]
NIHGIQIAGTVGTGLFLGSGQAISGAGPVGALFAYIFVGSVAFASLCSIGEMTSMAPVTGSFPYYASRWVDQALGFAVCLVTIPSEVSGALLLLSIWNVEHIKVYTVLILGVIFLVNIFGVKHCSSMFFPYLPAAVIMIFILIVIGFVIDLGGAPDHVRLGFKYWINPGPLTANVPPVNKFLGILSAIVQASAAYQGIEISTIAAAETENPRRNVARAMKKAFFRISIFYIAGVFVAGLIVPSTDPHLLQPIQTVYASPFVIGMINSGFGLPVVSVINAGLLCSAISAGNSFLFSASRILYGLALRGQAPWIFAITDRRGVPVPAVLFAAAFGFLAFINIPDVFQSVLRLWFYHLAAVGELVTWAIINLTYLRYYRGMAVQLRDRKELIYWSRFQPWLAAWGLFWCIAFICLGGYPVFRGFQKLDRVFIAYYLLPPTILGLFGFWKLLHDTFIWHADEMNFVSSIPTIDETEQPVPPPRGFWERIADRVF